MSLLVFRRINKLRDLDSLYLLVLYLKVIDVSRNINAVTLGLIIRLRSLRIFHSQGVVTASLEQGDGGGDV